MPPVHPEWFALSRRFTTRNRLDTPGGRQVASTAMIVLRDAAIRNIHLIDTLRDRPEFGHALVIGHLETHHACRRLEGASSRPLQALSVETHISVHVRLLSSYTPEASEYSTLA